MISTKYASIIAVAAFISGSFVASPELRAFAANTVGSADIINESILSVDIKNGEVKTDDMAPSAVGSLRIKDNDVKAQDIAPNAVGASELANGAVNSAKIADGTIAYGDVSRNLIVVEHRADCDCGGTGWDPDGTSSREDIYDNRINQKSVVVVTPIDVGLDCFTATPDVALPFVQVFCEENLPDNMAINYAIFNHP